MTLGEYLKYWRKNRGDTLAKIQKRAQNFKEYYDAPGSTAYFNRLEKNLIKVSPSILEYLSEVYEASLIILEYFLPEEHEHFIHLTKEKGFKPTILKDPKTIGANYNITQKRLKDSNLVLVFLKIQPGGSSRKDHFHPGEEIIKVNKGKNIHLVLPELENRIPLNDGDIFHFDSNQNHYLENNSNQMAEFFIIRMLLENKKKK